MWFTYILEQPGRVSWSLRHLNSLTNLNSPHLVSVYMAPTVSHYGDSLGCSAEDKATTTGRKLVSGYGHVD